MSHSKSHTIFLRICIIFLIISLSCITILTAPATAMVEVRDSFSNTILTDVTIYSDTDIPDATITFNMSKDGKQIQKKTLSTSITRGEQTFVTSWDLKLSEGSYDMDIKVSD